MSRHPTQEHKRHPTILCGVWHHPTHSVILRSAFLDVLELGLGDLAALDRLLHTPPGPRNQRHRILQPLVSALRRKRRQLFPPIVDLHPLAKHPRRELRHDPLPRPDPNLRTLDVLVIDLLHNSATLRLNLNPVVRPIVRYRHNLVSAQLLLGFACACERFPDFIETALRGGTSIADRKKGGPGRI